MPKTAVQTPICDICGADVREGSLFCYNCGGSLKQAEPREAKVAAPPAAPALPPNGSGKGAALEKRPPRRPRKVERGPVEVVWEPREGISVPFLIGSILLLFIAVVLFIAAMWLK